MIEDEARHPHVGRGEPMSRGRFLLALVLGLAGLAILLSLGTWQVQRLQWKEALIAEIEARRNAEPASLETIEERYEKTGDVDYFPVALSGEFVHSGEWYYLTTRDGQPGWNVYTPLQTGESEFVFVNRGFVPYEMRDPATRPGGQVEGPVSIEGLARNAQGERSSWLTPDNDPEERIFYWSDLDLMAGALDLPEGARVLSFLIDAGVSETRDGYPIGGATVISFPNNHLQYAITWFSLAAILAVMLGWMVWARFGRRRA